MILSLDPEIAVAALQETGSLSITRLSDPPSSSSRADVKETDAANLEEIASKEREKEFPFFSRTNCVIEEHGKRRINMLA